MNEQQLKEMKSYLLVKNSAGGCMLVAACIIFVAALAGAIACYVSCIVDPYGSWLFPAIMLTVLTLIFGALLFMSLVWPRLNAKKQQKTWLENGRLEEIVADFANAEKPAGALDFVRLGNTWIFGRACGKPVEYSNIRKLQVQTLKSNGMPLETTLYATLNNGDNVAVCREIRKAEAGKAIAAAKKAIMHKKNNMQKA